MKASLGSRGPRLDPGWENAALITTPPSHPCSFDLRRCQIESRRRRWVEALFVRYIHVLILETWMYPVDLGDIEQSPAARKTLRKRRHIVAKINRQNKPVGDWISAPSPNFVAVATRVGPTTFYMVPLNRPSPKPPGRCKHLRSICHTSRVIGDFVQIFGSKFWALGGLNKKNRRNSFVEGHKEKWRPKWLDSIEKQKRRSNLKECDRRTDIRTEGQTDSQLLTIIDS